MAERLNTQVPAEGAELLAQGMLCRHAIPTFKAPEFRAGYDLVAVNPETKKSVLIQVKSRFQTDCDRAFIVYPSNANFFIFVFLNMGNWYSGRPSDDVKSPEFYVVPSADVYGHLVGKVMPKFFIRDRDPAFDKYRDAWQLVAKALSIKADDVLLASVAGSPKVPGSST